MKINRKELRSKLAALKPGLAKREFIAQATHFIFFNGTIATYNDSISITCPFKCDYEFSVKGEEFFRLIDGISDEIINLAVEKGKVKVRSTSTTSSMSTIDEDSNILPKKIGEMLASLSEWKELPVDFLEGISLCAFSTSLDLSSGVRACVAIVGDCCYSTDGNRLSRYTMKSAVDDTNFNLISKDVMELVKFPVKEYCINDGWAHFCTEDGVIFSTSLIQGELPIKAINKYLEGVADTESTNIPDNLTTTLTAVSMLATDITDKSGKLTYLRFEDGEIMVKAENDLGWVEKTIKCDFKGEPLNITINNHFLSQILQKSAILHWKDDLLFFTSGDFIHLLRQVKVATVED